MRAIESSKTDVVQFLIDKGLVFFTSFIFIFLSNQFLYIYSDFLTKREISLWLGTNGFNLINLFCLQIQTRNKRGSYYFGNRV